MTGYEKDIEGDGLLGHYYNNLQWRGEPVKRIDTQVRFLWANEAPVDNVGSNDFTVEWIGLIKVPKTGMYTLTCEADDGCQVSINGDILINDNISPPDTDDLLKVQRKVMDDYAINGEFLDFIRPRTSDDPTRFPRKNYSDPIVME